MGSRLEQDGPTLSPTLAQDTRKALRKLARSVVIITSERHGQRFAMTATAVSEVSMEPPSMLVCVNRSSSMYAPLSAGADFVVNILHDAQRDLAILCAGGGKGESRFASGAWEDTEFGVPRLCDALANLVCRQVNVSQIGSHAVIIGEVKRVYVEGAINPLLYVDGGYGELMRQGLG